MTADLIFTSITVDESHNGERLDKFLSFHEAIESRSRAAQLIERNFVKSSSGQALTKPSYKVRAGESIFVHIPEKTDQTKLEPLALTVPILYEDSDLLVVNKPAGLVVHPAAGHAQDTLVNALLFQVKDLAMGFGEHRPGIVHRLDKDTSGLLVVAKNDWTQAQLASQFKEKTVGRIYKALVFGHPKEDSGTIVSYLIRHPIDRKRFASERVHSQTEPKGKRSVTHFRVIERYSSGVSLIQCELETGRTHQIRVHLSEKQHPLLGDNIYGSKSRVQSLKSQPLRKIIHGLGRVALHAETIRFLHPRQNKTLEFVAPWPEDLTELLHFLDKGAKP